MTTQGGAHCVDDDPVTPNLIEPKFKASLLDDRSTFYTGLAWTMWNPCAVHSLPS